MLLATSPSPTPRRVKRPFSTLSSTPHSSFPSSPSSPSSSSSSSSSSDDEPPHKKLAQTLNRLSLSSTPVPESAAKDIEMRQRKSYEKDSFTTVIESLSTTDSEDDDENDGRGRKRGVSEEAPFPRDENHVSIISEIEKRLTQLPHTLLVPAAEKERTSEGALVLYRSPESMGLPRSDRHAAEELKAAMRKRIMEKRKGNGSGGRRHEVGDGYEADAEDWEEVSSRKPVHAPVHPPAHGFYYGGNGDVGVNGFQDGIQGGAVDNFMNDAVDEDDEDDGEMMDLD